jgi:hypothetical protein
MACDNGKYFVLTVSVESCSLNRRGLFATPVEECVVAFVGDA